MRPVIHQTVRALLQAAADERPLKTEERLLLQTHLAECAPCRGYSRDLDGLQDGLRRVMRTQWNMRPGPLPLQPIKDRSRRVILQNRITSAVGRFAVIPVLAIALVMSVRLGGPQQLAVDITNSGTPGLSFHTPTPPTRLTATRLIPAVCTTVAYRVQKNDTLDGIAARYGVPRESILAYNGLASSELPVDTELVIPICENSPTGTTTTPTVTNTIIPQDAQLSPSPTG